MVGGDAARRRDRGGEGIQAPRPSRLIAAAGALAAYGGVVADALTRDPSLVKALVPGAVLGALLLLFALVRWEVMLGWALFLGGATYVAAVAPHAHGVDGTAPLVAALLLLCGELTAWSRGERGRIRADEALAWRRAAALGALTIAGLVASGLVVALGSVRPSHGLLWTALGTAAAVGAVGMGAVLARGR